MRIAFIDFAPWDYNIATPTLRPLGGSQSAMCYLAVELVRLGHEVATFTHTRQPRRISGVTCSAVGDLSGLNGFDVVVCLNSPGFVVNRSVCPGARFILWTQLAANQVAMRKLGTKAIRDAWDGIVCVSDWHARDLALRFGCDATVLRNAIAPAFDRLFDSERAFVVAKDCPERLAYTSTPYRGLQFLSSIFPAYRALKPETVLDVFSSMAVYMESAAEDRSKFAHIYDALSSIKGVNLHGSVSQPALARRMTSTHVWAYPNAFPETSCIAAMEAMAAGLRVVTSDLGALPETCEGFAKLVPIDIEIDDAKAAIKVKNSEDYIAAFVHALSASERSAADLYAQVVHMNQHHTWAVRAKQWVEFLTSEKD